MAWLRPIPKAPGRRRAASRLGLCLLLSSTLAASACRCGVDEGEGGEAEGAPAAEAEADDGAAVDEAGGRSEGEVETTPRSLTIEHASELEGVDLSKVERLDLALSERDIHVRSGASQGEGSGEDSGSSEGFEDSEGTGVEVARPSHPRCEGLDLHALAEATPRLTALRISGCQGAVHAGLSAFGARLRELELVDIELDAVTVARLSQLHGLDTLILTRVRAEAEALNPLARKISPSTVTLRELDKDSAVVELVTLLRDLHHLRLEGAWVGHNTMLRVAKAKSLQSLAVIDTALTNYSLHPLKGLDHLHRIEWSGQGWSNTSPQYLRDLPIDELICDCPRFGDRGLFVLRYLEGLQVLELERSAVTSAGLVHLAENPALEDLTLRGCDLDSEGFTALAALPRLRRLIVGPASLLDGKAEGLGLLVSLRELELGLDGFGDRAAQELAPLVNLERLDLGNTAVSDEGLEHLAGMVRLRELELHHTRVTRHGLEHLQGLSALEILELDHTDVVDDGVAHLAKLGALRELRLDNTLITDAGVAHLAKLSDLERLNLANTVVTSEGVEVLSALPRLEVVNLAGTRARD